MSANFFKDEANLIQVIKLGLFVFAGIVGYLKINTIIHLLQSLQK